MKYYVISDIKFGNTYNYPNVGHSDYKNAGYNPDKTKCIWVAKDDVDMKADEFLNVKEISRSEFDVLIDKWSV